MSGELTMKKLAIAKMTASALVLGTLMAATGASVQAQGSAHVSDGKALQKAAAAAQRATAALTKKQTVKAVTFAEIAVAFQPRDARYRLLLGQAYLAAGRFQSAEQSFVDTLTLDPERERAALNLALAQVAQGKKDAARSTLADYRDKLPAADFGLAMALAGDPDEAVRILEFATRAPDATAKTRQNLALAYALQGKWANARVMAVQDMTPDEADARVSKWAEFVRPAAAADQVATLLGVMPQSDGGQPSRLALVPFNPAVQTASAPQAVAPVAPVVAEPMPEPVAVAVAAPEPQPAFEVAATPAVTPVPVVQPTPKPVLIRAEPRPVRQAIVQPSRPVAVRNAVAFRPASTGKFVVQIGAFQNAANAQRAWNRVSSRVNLANYTAINGFTKVSNASVTRVAIGGIGTRAEAVRLCARIQQTGGTCFVRTNAGDSPARWAQNKTVKFASR